MLKWVLDICIYIYNTLLCKCFKTRFGKKWKKMPICCQENEGQSPAVIASRNPPTYCDVHVECPGSPPRLEFTGLFQQNKPEKM